MIKRVCCISGFIIGVIVGFLHFIPFLFRSLAGTVLNMLCNLAYHRPNLFALLTATVITVTFTATYIVVMR